MPLLAPEPERPVERGPVPSFSVVMAAYNAAHVIADAVQSALDQVPPPFEVIVCDDGSTDATLDVLASFGDRVTALHEPHRGEAAAKNAAVAAARGDYVAVLDADDRFLPGRLAALGEAAAARPDLDVLTTDAFLEVGGATIRRCYDSTFPFAPTDQRVAIVSRNFVFGMVAVRRSRLLDVGGFDTAIRYTTDWDCWIRMVLSGSAIGLLDEPLAVYRLAPSSMSAHRAEMSRGRLATLTKTAARPDLSPRERRALERAMGLERRRLAHEDLRSALHGGRRVRRQALAIVFAHDERPGTRAKAAVVAIVPSVVRRWDRRRADRRWIGAGGIAVKRRP